MVELIFTHFVNVLTEMLLEEDIRPEVEVQLLIQQQLLQHQVLLQYLENILEAKEGDYPPSSQDLQAQITQLMGAARSGLMGYQPPVEEYFDPTTSDDVTDPQKILEQVDTLNTYIGNIS